MRCPKCGYISFDHLEKCLKCNKDIKEAARSLFGSTYNVKAPVFLNPHREQSDGSSGSDRFGKHSADVEDEFLDEELDILVDEDESDEESEVDPEAEEQSDLDLSDEELEEDKEIEIDFSQFEDGDGPEVKLFDENEAEDEAQPDQMEERPISMDIPEELTDMSDLAPPGKVTKEEEQPAESPTDSESADMELDEFDFDLALDDLDQPPAQKAGIPKEAVLALDEIDFSEALAEGSSDASKKPGDTDMDEDLDFNLDLGGLSIHNDLK